MKYELRLRGLKPQDEEAIRSLVKELNLEEVPVSREMLISGRHYDSGDFKDLIGVSFGWLDSHASSGVLVSEADLHDAIKRENNKREFNRALASQYLIHSRDLMRKLDAELKQPEEMEVAQ